MGTLAVLTLLSGGLSGDGLDDGSLVSAVLVRSDGSGLAGSEGPGGGDTPGDGGEGPLDIVVEVSTGHEHGDVGSRAVGVSSGDGLVLLADVDALLPDVGHVDGTEVSDTEEEGDDVTVGDGVVGELFSSDGLDGEHIGTVLAGELGALEELVGVGVLGLVDLGPESLVSLTLVGDGLPDGAVQSVLLVELLADGLLTGDDRGAQLLLVHLGDPLGLELDVGESGGDTPVEDVLGDVVDVLLPQLLGILLGSGPGGVVDLGDDVSGSDLQSEAVGHGVLGRSEDHVVSVLISHFGASSNCHSTSLSVDDVVPLIPDLLPVVAVEQLLGDQRGLGGLLGVDSEVVGVGELPVDGASASHDRGVVSLLLEDLGLGGEGGHGGGHQSGSGDEEGLDLLDLGDSVDDRDVTAHVDDVVSGSPHHDGGDVLSDVVGVSLGGVHDDGGLGGESSGDLLLGESDSDLHGLGGHHDLGQVVDVLRIQLGDDFHSGDKTVVDDVEGVPLLQGLHDGGPDGLEPHVHDLLSDLVEDRVGREELLRHLLRRNLDLHVDVVALEDFAEVCTFATKHFIPPQGKNPYEAKIRQTVFLDFVGCL